MARNPWVLPDGFDADTRKALKAIFVALKKTGQALPEDAYQQLRFGNIDAFMAYIDWNKLKGEFGSLQEIMAAQAKSAGKSTFTLSGVENQLLFDLIDERAVIYAREASARLVTDISDQMRETIRETIAEAEMGNLTYQQAAIRLQSTLPLTARDSKAVNKFAEKQFARFMKQGLAEAKARYKAEQKAAQYAAKLLDARSRTIARTEIIDASMSGRYLGWEAGVTAGYISNDSVKEWVAEPDACEICQPLDGTIIGWNTEWTFPEGVTAGTSNRMPPAHPNCRCAVVILPPDYLEDIFTAQSGGQMPKAADEFTKSIGESEFLKHMQGRHDQSEHGRKGSKSFDAKNYDDLKNADQEQFERATRNLTLPDGTYIDEEYISAARARLGYRSIPSPDHESFDRHFDNLDREVTDFIKTNPVSVFVPEEVIENIIDDGKIKSIYESQDVIDAKGQDYLAHRTVYEYVAFDYDQTFPNDKRPVSGTVLPSENNKEAFYAFGENYGSAQIVLKDEVKSRMTFTVGDSLDKFQQPTKLGGKVPRTMDLMTTAQGVSRARESRGTSLFADKTWLESGNYIETQVHGGVKLSDIDKIIFHSPEIDIRYLGEKLDDLGIKWEETSL